MLKSSQGMRIFRSLLLLALAIALMSTGVDATAQQDECREQELYEIHARTLVKHLASEIVTGLIIESEELMISKVDQLFEDPTVFYVVLYSRESAELLELYREGHISDNFSFPDLIISSHAVRAFETAKIIANAFNYPENKIVVSESLYFCELDNCYNLFFDLADDVDSLMIVGHNPVFTYFANEFLNKPIDNLPTSGVVCIEFKTNKWEEVVNAKHKTKFVISPKTLKESGR